MALIQEILVPLLAVNDTTLTVVEVSLANGAKVAKGDLIMVFETSKTTYDVEAQADGYIQYLCEADRDYEVNAIVARIYSEEAEAAVVVAGAAAPKAPRVAAGAGARGAGAVGPAMRGAAGGVKGGVGLNGHEVDSATPLTVWEGETVFSHSAEELIASAGIDKEVFRG